MLNAKRVLTLLEIKRKTVPGIFLPAAGTLIAHSNYITVTYYFMKYLFCVRCLLCAVIFMLLTMEVAFCQHPVVRFNREDYTKQDSIHLMESYGKNKKLIPQFALPALIALSYFPELKDTHIRFIYKPAHATLATKPVFPYVLLTGSKRTFVIIVSDSTMWKLEPIILPHMDFNAQIGIIGHELSHVVDFSQRSLWSLAGEGVGHLSSKYLDCFEYRTDSICIAHGLGYQLLEWSMYIRSTMHTKNWDGADNINEPVMKTERYMNPSTIRKRIQQSALYQK